MGKLLLDTQENYTNSVYQLGNKAIEILTCDGKKTTTNQEIATCAEDLVREHYKQVLNEWGSIFKNSANLDAIFSVDPPIDMSEMKSMSDFIGYAVTLAFFFDVTSVIDEYLNNNKDFHVIDDSKEILIAV